MDDNEGENFEQKETFTKSEEENLDSANEQTQPTNDVKTNELLDPHLNTDTLSSDEKIVADATKEQNQEDKDQALDEQSPQMQTLAKQEEPREQTSLEDISLDVRFEMNRIQTTLSELKNFESGYIFDFNLNADTIYLTVAGKTIGKGQLVEIGEKVGVRITEIYK